MPFARLFRKSHPVAARFARHAVAALCALSVGLASLPVPALAQGSDSKSKLIPIRDAEVEELVRDYATPVLRAAGLDPKAVEIVLIRDFSFNAFVANGQRIFINLGAIIDSQTPNELIGVLAHETGHIAGGHLATLRQKMDAAQTRAMIATLLGVAAVAAGAASGGNTRDNAGAAAGAAIMGPQEMIKRDLISYVRSQEQAADQAAVTYLNKTGQSAKGMLTVFKRFADSSMFTSRFIDPYAQTHPMPQERIALLERLAQQSPNFSKTDSEALVRRHQMARAKTIAFLQNRDQVMRRYPAYDTSMPARYARAIAAYRFGEVDAAQREIDTLIASEPGNPYFWELKGQALLEAGRARQAIEPLRKAVSLKPSSGLIRSLLGQALVQTGDKSLNAAAIQELRAAIQRETASPDAYRQLAIAYGRAGQNGEADLASSQASLYEGDITLAKQLSMRAKNGLPTGSPSWLKADDIVNYRAGKLSK